MSDSKRPTMGIKHLTVVPTNWQDDGEGESEEETVETSE